MSGGSPGLAGYIYQQRYLAFQVLSSVAAGKLPGYPSPRKIKEFAIEGREGPSAPAWDVLFHLDDDSIHLRECKDTPIRREDRSIFYRRVRKELHAGTSVHRLTVGWVTDRDKQGNILDHFSGMAELCKRRPLTLPSALPDEVNSAETALAEATYYLCSHLAENHAPPPLSLDDARNLLSRLAIEQHGMQELEEAVQHLATGTFTTGTGEAIDKYITGELTIEICRGPEARYTVDGFLAAVKVGTFALEASETFGDLLRFHSGAGHAQTAQGVRWARLEGEPCKVWLLEERFPGFDGKSCLITASIGVGKTVTSQQAFAAELGRRNPHHVLLIEARDVNEETTSALLRLVCILCGIAETWLCIDGLDEVPAERREEWSQLVRRLLRVPRLILLVTARQEVVAAYAWLQDIGLPVRDLLPLTNDQLGGEFHRVALPVPTNPSLLRALRTPLLLALYAKVVTPEDMPLADSGEVTAFQVIEAFWQRTVLRTSVGHRATGSPERSQSQKRMAAEEMVQQTLRGELLLRPGNCLLEVADGFETLHREGVVVRQGTHAYRWVHDWVREYALVDYLISVNAEQTMVGMLEGILRLRVDHVGRTAAVAWLKWIIAHPERSTAQQYLVQLWERNRGYASDALTVLVEDDSGRLVLAELPTPLLVELIEQARLIRARQWGEQVATLPLGRFAEDDGRLHAVVTGYELEVG